MRQIELFLKDALDVDIIKGNMIAQGFFGKTDDGGTAEDFMEEMNERNG
jgi:hypothetical protein